MPIRPAKMFFRLHLVNDDLRSAGKGWVYQAGSVRRGIALARALFDLLSLFVLHALY